jgi:plastocyanin
MRANSHERRGRAAAETHGRAALRRRVSRAPLALLALATLAIIAGAGCGTSRPFDPTPVKTFKITPAAATRSPAAAATAPATAPATAAAVGDGADAPPLDLIGRDSKFDRTELSASAGAVTIRFDNRDAGVPHNVHVYRGTGAGGESMGQTELDAGPVKQELRLNLQPGAYYYQCDAHPSTMKGTLTVR